MSPRPQLLTFDIFGTVLDWRSGLQGSCAAAGRTLVPGDFDRIIDAQARLEQGDFLDYATVTQRSLIEILGLDEGHATEIGRSVGRWPLFPDAAILRSLMRIAPCVAMTNSDRTHGEELQSRFGFRLDGWLCAEDVRLYKPHPDFWRHAGRLRKVEPGPEWWHVSAYADYDLSVAGDLGLTTVFVHRPHSRPGPSSFTVDGIAGLLDLLS